MQDFLTSLIVATFLFSVVNFGLLFVFSLPTREQRFIINSSSVTPIPSVSPLPVPPIATTPLLPTISVEQADQNLDEQITALRLANNFPLECRTLLTSPTAPAKNKSPRKAKAKNIQQSNTIASKSTEEKTPNKKSSLTDIRNLCSTNKIKWQNVHGKNQHLTKTEMIDALKNQGLTL